MSTERETGLQALQQGNAAAAVPLLETACQQNPGDFDSYLFLGAAYGQVGRQMDAINTITRAVQIQPANAQARYNLAVAMEQGGYREQAVQALGQALTLQPDYPKAQEALSRLQGADAPTAPGYASQPAAPAAPMYGQPPASPGAAPAETTAYSQPSYEASSGLAAAAPPNYPQNAPPNPYGAPPPNPYAAQPTATPYAAPPAANPWAPPPAASPYPPARPGPYPYAAQPVGGPAYVAQRFEPIYAGFWLRAGAYIIDNFLLVLIVLPISFVIGAVLGATMGASGARTQDIILLAQILGQTVALVVMWLYYALFESSVKQATPGKQALGLIVTDLDGNRIGFMRASGRFFGKIISGCLLTIGYIMAGFTEKKQALHDIMAGCLVVKR